MNDRSISNRTINQVQMREQTSPTHHFKDDITDEVRFNQTYNHDSQTDQQRRHRPRRPVQSIPYHPNDPLVHNNREPMIHGVLERPDPDSLRYQYNPYELGDIIHDIEPSLHVSIQSHYQPDGNGIRQSYPDASYRSQPGLFYDDARLNNRPHLNTDLYDAHPHRQRYHKFDDNFVYIDTMPRNRDSARVPVHGSWTERRPENDDRRFHLNPSDLNSDSARRNDYRDEYLLAKQTVASTKNLVSAIHDDLQQIVTDPSSDHYYM